jgi:hypothetical protein
MFTSREDKPVTLVEDRVEEVAAPEVPSDVLQTFTHLKDDYDRAVHHMRGPKGEFHFGVYAGKDKARDDTVTRELSHTVVKRSSAMLDMSRRTNLTILEDAIRHFQTTFRINGRISLGAKCTAAATPVAVVVFDLWR